MQRVAVLGASGKIAVIGDGHEALVIGSLVVGRAIDSYKSVKHKVRRMDEKRLPARANCAVKDPTTQITRAPEQNVLAETPPRHCDPNRQHHVATCP